MTTPEDAGLRRTPGAATTALGPLRAILLGVLCAAAPAVVLADTPPGRPAFAPPVGECCEHTYLVPAAAHTAGANGSRWTTDLVIHAPDAYPREAFVYFLERNRDNSDAVATTVEVPAASSVVVRDVVASRFGKQAASGALLVGSTGPLVVLSRTFNTGRDGTFGQTFEGYPTDVAFDHWGFEVRLIQLGRTEEVRTNIGVANASALGAPARVRLYAADGTALGSLTVDLPPFGFVQLDDVFARVGARDVADSYALVDVPSRPYGIRWVTYASVIDNRTNDPMTVVPRELSGAWRYPARSWLQDGAASGGTESGGAGFRGREPLTPGQAREVAADYGWVRVSQAPVGALAVTGAPSTLVVGNGYGAFRSTDGGLNWTDVGAGFDELERSVVALAADPADPLTVYAGCQGTTVRERPYAVTRKTTDGGATWTTLPIGGVSITSLAVSRSNPDVVYESHYGCWLMADQLVCNGGVVRSADAGGSWAGASGGDAELGLGRLAVHPAHPDEVWSRSWRTSDGGLSWARTISGVPAGVELDTPAFAPSSPEVLYAGSAGTVYRSTSGGAGWTPAGSGLPGVAVGLIAVDPADPDTAYAATAGGGLYRTRDGGASWFPASHGLPGAGIIALVADPASPDTVWAGTGSGLYRADFSETGRCGYALEPASLALTAVGGTGSLAVTGWGQCPWTASSDAAWLAITAGGTGTGDGTLRWEAAANDTDVFRVATVTVADRTFTVTQAARSCATPPAPTLTAPASATSAAAYFLAWSAVVPEATYELQESPDPTFASAAIVPVTGTTTSTVHLSGLHTAWLARVRAVHACNGREVHSAWSNSSMTDVGPEPATGSAVWLPAAAHTDGLGGTRWRTDLEVHSLGGSARFTVAVLKEGEGYGSVRAAAFALAGGQSLRLRDVLGSGALGRPWSGNATLGVWPTKGTMLTNSRTYNDQPDGTYGQSIAPEVPYPLTLWEFREARLVGLAESADPAVGFRTNLGLVSTSHARSTLEVALHRGDGTVLGTLPVTLEGGEYRQLTRVFRLVTAEDVPDGYAVISGSWDSSFLVYASVVDNRSGDPVHVPGVAFPYP